MATFTEVESEKIDGRPLLQAAFLRCQQSHATLLVAKLDRLSRNASFLLSPSDSGVKFQALDIPEANTLTLEVLAVLAQHEREIISADQGGSRGPTGKGDCGWVNPRDMSGY